MSRAAHDPRDEFLAAAFRSRADEVRPRTDCPQPERLWDAVRLQVPVEERLRLIDHLADCPTCAEAWRLAGELAAAELVASGADTGPERQPTQSNASSSLQGRTAVIIAMGVLVLLALGVAITVLPNREVDTTGNPQPGAAAASEPVRISPPKGAVPPLQTSDGAYRIKVVLNRDQDGRDVPLQRSDRLLPGDRVSVDVDVSAPVYFYVVSADERGHSSVAFPPAGGSLNDPLPAGRHRLPGPNRGDALNWQVTTTAGRQHFVVIASPTRAMLESYYAGLPNWTSTPTTDPTVSIDEPGTQRSRVGLVIPSVVTGGEPYIDRWFHDPIPLGDEIVNRVWIQEATFDYVGEPGSTSLTPRER